MNETSISMDEIAMSLGQLHLQLIVAQKKIAELEREVARLTKKDEGD